MPKNKTIKVPTKKRRRNTESKPKIKGSDKRYSYSFLTMGGRRFVELTPERFSRLHQKEQENILKTAKYTGEDIRKLTKEDWKQLYQYDGIGEKAYKRAVDIARGHVVASVEDIIITNYVEGIKKMGHPGLSREFEELARELKESNPDKYEMFMQEIPDLFLFYKDVGKSHVKRQGTFIQEVAEDQIVLLGILVDRYKEEKENEDSEEKNE